MSSTSPFKKKNNKDLLLIENFQNINFPRTFKELQQQKTYRTIVDSDTHFTLGDSRKTIVSEVMRDSRKESIGYSDDLLRMKEAQIEKLEESLILEKGINECLREEISKNKQRITELVGELDDVTEKNQNRRQHNQSNQKQEVKIIGILKNNTRKQQQQMLQDNQTLRFGSPKLSFKQKTNLQLQNKRLRKYIKDLEQNFIKCKIMLEDVEEKSKMIQTQYQADIRSLKIKNEYLSYQIKEYD